MVTRVPVGLVLVLCISLVTRFFVATWLCEFDRIPRLRDMKQRLRKRARAIFGMVLGSGDEKEDEAEDEDEDEEDDDDKQGAEDERRESGGTATAYGTAPTTLKDKRKRSRSSSWMPRILIRGATGDDINMTTMASRVGTNEAV